MENDKFSKKAAGFSESDFIDNETTSLFQNVIIEQAINASNIELNEQERNDKKEIENMSNDKLKTKQSVPSNDINCNKNNADQENNPTDELKNADGEKSQAENSKNIDLSKSKDNSKNLNANSEKEKSKSESKNVDENSTKIDNSAKGSKADENSTKIDNSAKGSKADEISTKVDNSAKGSKADEISTKVDNSAKASKADEISTKVDNSAKGSRADENSSRIDRSAKGSKADENSSRIDRSAKGSKADENSSRIDRSTKGSKSENESTKNSDIETSSQVDTSQTTRSGTTSKATDSRRKQVADSANVSETDNIPGSGMYEDDVSEDDDDDDDTENDLVSEPKQKTNKNKKSHQKNYVISSKANKLKQSSSAKSSLNNKDASVDKTDKDLAIVTMEDALKETEKQNKAIDDAKSRLVRQSLAGKGREKGIVKQKDIFEPLTYEILTKLAVDLRKKCEEDTSLHFSELDEFESILSNAHKKSDFEVPIPYHILEFMLNQLDVPGMKEPVELNRAQDFERVTPAKFTKIEKNPEAKIISIDAMPTKDGNEESNYIKRHVADALSKGLADLCLKRPRDPVYHLALFLRKYAASVNEFKQKEKELLEKKLKEEEEEWMRKVRKELNDYIKFKKEQKLLEEEKKRQEAEAEQRRREKERIRKATENLFESAFGPICLRVFENEPTDLLNDEHLDEFKEVLLTAEELANPVTEEQNEDTSAAQSSANATPVQNDEG